MVNYRSLIGIPWEYGVNDCFSLVRQYYALAGVALPDFKRPDDLESSHSIFLEHAAALGFVETTLDQIMAGDVLIMRLGTDAPMHAAIYVGDQQILHQRMNCLSGLDSLSCYYRRRTSAVFRYAADRTASGQAR
jgi:cell wall-associated NlpC family hydrolase